MATRVTPEHRTGREAGGQPDAAGRSGPRSDMPLAPRIVIQYPSPSVDDGRYPAKRCVGDQVQVEADVFRDGHELLRAVVRHRGPGSRRWEETEMHRVDAHLGGVRWAGSFDVTHAGRYQYTIEAWAD